MLCTGDTLNDNFVICVAWPRHTQIELELRIFFRIQRYVLSEMYKIKILFSGTWTQFRYQTQYYLTIPGFLD